VCVLCVCVCDCVCVCVIVCACLSVCLSVCILRPDLQTKPEIRWLKKGEVLEGLNIDKVFFFLLDRRSLERLQHRQGTHYSQKYSL
jgi:hypothetical protein